MRDIDWGTAAQWAGVVAALFIAIWGAMRQRGEKAIEDMAGDLRRIFERLDEADHRISKVEVEIAHVPTKDQLHALDVKITALGATMSSVASTLNRLQEHILEREAR